MAPNSFKSGFVVIVGRPNVGKSTLMNHLIGQKIAITSAKPQTTRNRIMAVYTCQKGQIIFLDTPGIHKASSKLGEYMDNVALRTISQADVIVWMVEPSKFSGSGEKSIASRLKSARKNVILVMNKIDTVDKIKIPEYMKMYDKLYSFDDIIPVSALKDENLDSVLMTILDYLPEGPKYYEDDTITDQTERSIASEIIREKALRYLRDEVPHGIAVEIISMKERPDREGWDIRADIITEKESHKGIIIGKGGTMLKKIGTSARSSIEEMMDSHVNLRLYVKVRRGWKDNALILQGLGYSQGQTR